MAAILGIYASQISGHLYAGPFGAYDALASVTVGSGGVASVSFTGIPSTYKHLQLRILANATSTAQAVMSFNGNTSSSKYSFHALIGNGSSASAAGYATGTLGGIVPSPRLGGGSYFGAAVIDVLDYANTNKNKTTRELMGWDGNGSGEVELVSGCYYDTAAVNSISFIIQGGGNFSEYSSFALYGVK